MEIKRYYYSERKKVLDEQMEEFRQAAREHRAFLDSLPLETQEEIIKSQQGAVEEALADLMILPEVAYTVVNVPRYNLFCKFAEESIAFAEKIGANLMVDTRDMSGCIILVGDELSHRDGEKDMLKKLADAADEVFMKVSVDTGRGEPMDVDGAVQIEYWFDFYVEIEK